MYHAYASLVSQAKFPRKMEDGLSSNAVLLHYESLTIGSKCNEEFLKEMGEFVKDLGMKLEVATQSQGTIGREKFFLYTFGTNIF